MPSLPVHLYLACFLGITENNNVTIRVMNISSPLYNFKGMKLGTCTETLEDSILSISIQDSAAPEDLPCPSNNSPSFNKIATPNLSAHEHSQLLDVLMKFQGIFAPTTGPQGCTSTMKYSIPTVGPPICQPMHCVPVALKDTINTEVNRMLEQNVIRPSCSPWPTPVVMVQKKDGSWRFCIGYLKFNSVTHGDAYPLPRIHSTIDSLAGSYYFTILDLAEGYWQVGLEKMTRKRLPFQLRRVTLSSTSCLSSLKMPQPCSSISWNAPLLVLLSQHQNGGEIVTAYWS